MDGGYKRDMNTSERTNNYSLGEYEDVGTIKKTTGQFKAAVVAGTMPNIDAGLIYFTTIDCPGGPLFSGNCRYNALDAPVLDVQNGLLYSFTITNQGPTSFNITGG
jgi:hypothetical protein